MINESVHQCISQHPLWCTPIILRNAWSFGFGSRLAVLCYGWWQSAQRSLELLRTPRMNHTLSTVGLLHVSWDADVRLPELHSIHQAKIINAFHDGIFVSLPGYEVDGLVHHSQISRQLEMDNTLPKVERFKRIQEIVGDIDYEVWVKIVYVARTEHLKCECSLKMVRAQNNTQQL
jgi:predicted RNA-binding protein with RPS1 domain